MNKLIFFIFILLPFSIIAQSFQIEINWVETDSIPFFQNALYDNPENSLPHYAKKVPWDDIQTVPEVRIENIESETIEGQAFFHQVRNQIGEEPFIEYEIATERKKPWLLIKLQPFIINSETGDIERINSFQLVIHKQPAIALMKSAMIGSYIENSMLQTGSWFKVAIEETGIHKLTYSQLQEMGIQSPENVRIFGSGGRQLPENFSLNNIDDISPIPVYFQKGSDNQFGQGDFILFYANGPVEWSFNETDQFFEQELHDYSWRGYYFLTDNHGLPDGIQTAELSGEVESHTITSFDYLQYFEEEKYNLLHSGKEWYGDNFSVNLSGNYPFQIPESAEGETIKLKVCVAGRSNEASVISSSINGNWIGDMTFSSTNLSSYTSIYAYENSEIYEHIPNQNILTVTIEYQQPNSNSEAWLNYITVNARNSLKMFRDVVDFRDYKSVGFGNVGLFKLENATGETEIWDVTDPGNPMEIEYTLVNQTAEFKVETDGLREFIAFNPDGEFPSPAYDGPGLGQIENQNLHGITPPDMIIIFPDEFRSQAERLANFRIENDGLEIILIEQTQVFNEFSSGTPDATAIRNLMKMFYDKAEADSTKMPRYLLLFGDGSYDNRNVTEQNPNKILTYQSNNSLSPTNSYVSDDYFGLLDSGESLYSGLLDIGIGRFPVTTSEEAEDVVDKVISYSQKKNLGDWRNYICFIGDDEDSNTHMRQADILARDVESKYPNFNINKIYLDAYPQETTPTGDRYPDVSRLLNEQVRKGALIINYTGHGGPNGLAHEQILTRSHINAWDNEEMLPLFMTATCEFSRYDEYNHIEDLEETSAGEEILLNSIGGGIALFTTTRLVYSGPNHVLNEHFYDIVFETDENNKHYRLGDIIAYSKNNADKGYNKRNFTLLGDPSLKLVIPEHFVFTDSINGVHVSEITDTISALEYVTIAGHLEDATGNLLKNFNGEVNPVVYDKERKIETLANDGGSAWNFNSRNSVIYKGATSVNDGRFSFGFFIPKDINYAFGKGKISFYGSDSLTDAHGSSSALIVGGIGDEVSTDDIPPMLEVFMNDSLFKPGGITDSEPELLVYINDNFGVNTTGNGIGHDITSTLDGDRYNAIILNEFYRSDMDSYNSGTVRYPYTELEPGKHEINVKVWDIHNNSAEAVIEFIVVESAEMLLEQIYNFPNPFIDRTWFNVEHNKPDEEIKVEIRIFNLSGQLVAVINQDDHNGGYRIEPVEWDGTGSGGAAMGGGVYVYTVNLSTVDGEHATGSGKLIITR